MYLLCVNSSGRALQGAPGAPLDIQIPVGVTVRTDFGTDLGDTFSYKIINCWLHISKRNVKPFILYAYFLLIINWGIVNDPVKLAVAMLFCGSFFGCRPYVGIEAITDYSLNIVILRKWLIAVTICGLIFWEPWSCTTLEKSRLDYILLLAFESKSHNWSDKQQRHYHHHHRRF